MIKLSVYRAQNHEKCGELVLVYLIKEEQISGRTQLVATVRD
jgi:hypothetical protein